VKRAAMLVFVLACTKPIAHPTTADVTRAAATRPQTTIEELEHGRTLYVQRCGNCHEAYQPNAYASDAWPKQVDEMAERAKLAASDRELVVLFLVTMASR
jgi:hypothetical protein